MLGITLVVASIGLADSVNPSTLIPALWLASSPSKSRLASYTAGVFAVYLSGGIVLLLGPGPALIAFLHHLRGPVEHGVEALAGMLVLAFASALWRSRHKVSDQPRMRRSHTRASAFALGADHGNRASDGVHVLRSYLGHPRRARPDPGRDLAADRVQRAVRRADHRSARGGPCCRPPDRPLGRMGKPAAALGGPVRAHCRSERRRRRAPDGRAERTNHRMTAAIRSTVLQSPARTPR